MSSRLDLALSLLLQAPPGQTSQVYHDLRGILLDPDSHPPVTDAELQSAAQHALRSYNVDQLIPVTLDGEDATVICEHASLGDDRYAHPRAAKSFVFDHVKRTVSDVQPLQVNAEAEKIRAPLDSALKSYVADRYQDGVSSVFALPLPKPKPASKPQAAPEPEPESESALKPETETKGEAEAEAKPETEGEGVDKTDGTKEEEPQTAESSSTKTKADPEPEPEAEAESEAPTTFVFHHVGNRYHLSNFWSGRWRATYTLDPATKTLDARLAIQVHYFENGNVQLNAAKPATLTLSSLEPRDIVRAVEKHEDAYQAAIERVYDDLSEKAFKALRRQLPVTRQKVDWDKVTGYKLGAELAKS